MELYRWQMARTGSQWCVVDEKKVNSASSVRRAATRRRTSAYKNEGSSTAKDFLGSNRKSKCFALFRFGAEWFDRYLFDLI